MKSNTNNIQRLIGYLSACTMVFCSFGSIWTGAAGNPSYETRNSLQPIGNAMHMDDVINWSPESDPDARYNRSVVPLADRYQGEVVNPNADPRVKVNNVAISNSSTGYAPSQGTDSSNVYSFTYWQYVDRYTYWGGSGRDGIIVIPTPDVIDAAHKNGVPVTGTIFFPNDSSDTTWLWQFAEKAADGSYPVADKLIEIAAFYGFDGYFINQETHGGNEVLAAAVKQTMQYLHNNKPHDAFQIIWYDSMTNQGSINWQNQVNQQNGVFLQDGNTTTADHMFLNFNWDRQAITSSVNYLTHTLGRSAYDVFAAWDIQGDAYHTSTLSSKKNDIRDQDGAVQMSLGFYCANATVGMSKNASDFLNNHENMMWTGPSADPTVNDLENSNWNGVAQYAADKTAILSTPFVTNFNTGLGYHFYIDGKIAKQGHWNNRSLQDILPTWRWSVVSDGTKLQPSFDFDHAYYGGSSLKIAGRLQAEAPNMIRLYSSKLRLHANSSYTAAITYQTAHDAGNMDLVLYTAEDYSQAVSLPVDNSETGQWTTATLSLQELEGKTIYGIALKCHSDTDIDHVDINIGSLSITEDTQTLPLSAPESVTLDDYLVKDAKSAQARIYWDKVSGAAYYELYQVYQNGTRQFLNACYNNAFYINKITKEMGVDDVTIEVVAVSDTMQRGAGGQLTFVFGTGDQDTSLDEKELVNLALYKEVKASNENVAEPAFKAVDGIIPNSKWCTSTDSGWIYVDMEQSTTVQRWVVQHANAPGAEESPDFNTRDFALEYSDDAMTWTEAQRITDNTKDITDETLDQPITARYFRLNIYDCQQTSNWKAIRIYEFELYQHPEKPRTSAIPMEHVKAANREGANDSVYFKGVEAGTEINIYDSMDAQTPIAQTVTVGEEVTAINHLNFSDDSGRVYYDCIKMGSDLRMSHRYSVSYLSDNTPQTGVPPYTSFAFTSDRMERVNLADYYYHVLKVDAQAGTIVRLYNDQEEIFHTRISPVVTANAAGTSIERVELAKTGGYIYLTVQEPGKAESQRFRLYYDKDGMVYQSKMQLQDLVTDAINIDMSLYTAESVAVLQQSIVEAEKVLENTNATNTTVQAAHTELELALKGLERIIADDSSNPESGSSDGDQDSTPDHSSVDESSDTANDSSTHGDGSDMGASKNHDDDDSQYGANPSTGERGIALLCGSLLSGGLGVIVILVRKHDAEAAG